MFKTWKYDFMSSIVVFLVALPLCLGIALASNAPMASGLIAGVVGAIVVGFISDSHVSVSGPAAGLTVIVINGISQLGSFEAFTLAVFLSGIFQIIFGVMKAGSIGNYFPTAVIKGMLAAIGLILILKQAPNVVGSQGIIMISVICLGLILLWEQIAMRKGGFFKLIPGALLAVMVSILLNKFFVNLGSEYLVQLPESFGAMRYPDYSRLLDWKVVVVAITIAVVASLETLLCVDAAEKLDPEKRPTSKDRELLAQGIGNTISGLIGGLPITAVIVRTTANISAGAKSKLSAIMHGFWIVVCVALIPNVLNMIPLASLACILLLTGYKLCKPTLFVEMKKRGWDQLVVFCSTIAAILATDLLKGIFVGILVAVIIEFRHFRRNPFKAIHGEDNSILEFSDNVTFFHKAKISQFLKSMKGKTLHIKNYTKVTLHVDVHELIMDHKHEMERNGINVIIN